MITKITFQLGEREVSFTEDELLELKGILDRLYNVQPYIVYQPYRDYTDYPISQTYIGPGDVMCKLQGQSY